MAELPSYIPPKEELRARLSLHYVCAKLGIQLNDDDYALCPFHEDQRPSFYLWDGDDGVQRFWCQPCGFGGDLFDLIQRVEQTTFGEAQRRAAALLAELPPGYEPPRRPTPTRVTADSFQAEVEDARLRAQRDDHAGILSTRAGIVPVEEVALAQRWDAYLRGTWGLGIGANGTIYMPHWDAAGVLTGCKLRFGDGKKESLPGSRYENLYGSWLGRRHHAVLLTEGESDAWWAGWAAAEERVPVDIFALPSGAKEDVPAQWISFLNGTRIIYLGFDPDSGALDGAVKGVEATRAWVQALDDANFEDVRVCVLPLGRDLRDAKPSLDQLLRRARKPLLHPDNISSAPGGYVRTARNGNLYPATNWTVEPIARLAGGDEPGYDALLRTRGTTAPAVIRLADLANVGALNKWANRYGLQFTGGDADRKAIAEYVEWRGAVVPEIFQTDRVGLHEPPTEYHFAGPTVVLPDGYIGQLPWRYAPTLRAANVRDRIFLPAQGPFKWRWLEAMIALSTPDVTHPLLAWSIAAARRPYVREFPLMFVGGSSGVGKSTLARLFLRLLGSRVEIDLGANTPFILYRTLAASSSIPVFVDEWTRLSRQDTREAFQGIVPLLYTGGIAERGQADLSTTGYRVSAPTIVAGEDTFTLDRELERTVCVYPTRAAQNRKAHAFVQGEPIERFGHNLHRWLTTQPELPPLPQSADDRVEYNRQVLLAGWETLRAYLSGVAAYEEGVPDLPEIDLSCFEREPEDEHENVYETALVEASALADPNGIPVVWRDPQGRGTWVRFVALIGLIETRRLDVQLPGRSRAMRSYFEERYGRLDSLTVTPPQGMKSVRAHLIEGFHLQEESEVDALPVPA